MTVVGVKRWIEVTDVVTVAWRPAPLLSAWLACLSGWVGELLRGMRRVIVMNKEKKLVCGHWQPCKVKTQPGVQRDTGLFPSLFHLTHTFPLNTPHFVQLAPARADNGGDSALSLDWKV